MIGEHSELAAITSLLSDLQLSVTADETQTILARVRKHAVEHKGPVSEETVVAMWRDIHERSLLNGGDQVVSHALRAIRLEHSGQDGFWSRI